MITCQLDASNHGQPCLAGLRRPGGNLSGMPGPNQQAGGLAIGRLPISLDTWLEGSSTSSDLISEVGSIKDSEIMELYFVDNSDTVWDGTVQVVDVLVLQGPVGVTSAILVMEQALTMNNFPSAAMCQC